MNIQCIIGSTSSIGMGKITSEIAYFLLLIFLR